YHAISASPVNTGNLYLLVGGRPQLRVFARIPRRHTAWFLNNDSAGRGASQLLVNRHFTTTGPAPVPNWEPASAEAAVASEAPTLAETSISTTDRERIQPEPAAPDQERVEVQHADQSEAAQPTNHVESREKVRQAGRSQNKVQAEAVQQADPVKPMSWESPVQETVKYDAERERIRSKVALWDQEEKAPETKIVPLAEEQRFTPSDHIYVMGTDPVGRYIAHALAGCESLPPPYYMLHAYGLGKGWHRAGRRITVYEDDKIIPRDRIIAVDTSTAADYEQDVKGMVMKNLIVTVPAAHVLRALKPFVHRLDHRSTICLVNDGLGVAEDIIQAYFPSVLKRPTFLLGHFSTKLGHTEDQFSVEKVREGRLYLTLFQQTVADPLVRNRFRRHPPIERTQNAQHLLRLLTAVPDLYASGHPPQDFFRYKLPTIAFHAIIDPLTVLLDCTYDKLPGSTYARLLMDQMLSEVCVVVSRMWECRNSQKFQQFATSSKLRDEVWHKLMRRQTASSRMRTEAARGRDTDIDYLCGYFVKRGREQGLSVYTLDTVISEVKAKQQVAQARKAIDIPFEI
ncbi:ketopantoate reductase PanE/ApbA C terminal-domain-containing protein, partial [Cladorrhinum sp. PSN259]